MFDHQFFFFSSRRRHTRFDCDWSSDVCSSDLTTVLGAQGRKDQHHRKYFLWIERLSRRRWIRFLQDLDYGDRKSTRLNSSHSQISYAVFCLKKKNSGGSRSTTSPYSTRSPYKS